MCEEHMHPLLLGDKTMFCNEEETQIKTKRWTRYHAYHDDEKVYFSVEYSVTDWTVDNDDMIINPLGTIAYLVNSYSTGHVAYIIRRYNKEGGHIEESYTSIPEYYRKIFDELKYKLDVFMEETLVAGHPIKMSP
jgi:hypothetical protein